MGLPTKRLVATLIAAVLVAVLATAAYAQTGRIAGTVTAGDTKGPLAGATVEVMGPNLTKKMGAVSQADGRYAVENVPAGVYTIKATSIGYRGETIRNVVVSADASVEVDFRMAVTPYEMEEMVVSASRHAENIVDAPASISKVDEKEVQRNIAANSYVSLIKHAKGINYFQSGVLTERVSIRGFDSALNSRTQLFIDGRASQRPGNGLPLPAAMEPTPRDDVQDLEVITGPVSALYGPDAISGVIHITTKDPRESQGTTFAAAGGSRNTFKGRFRHAGMHSRWGWKVSGDYQKAHDFELVNRYFNADSSVSVTDDPDFDTNSLRGGFGLFYYPDDQSRLTFASGVSRSNYTAPINTGRGQNQVDYNYQQITYQSQRLYLNIYRTEDNGDVYFLHIKAQNLLAGLSPEEAHRRARNISGSSVWAGEGRYSFDVPQLKGHFNIGTDFRRNRVESTTNDAPVIIVRQIGLYSHSEIGLSEKLRVVLASRIDVHEIYSTQFSPKAALIFKPRLAVAFRATFNRAFKSPTIGEQRVLLRSSPTRVARGNSKGFRFGSVTGSPLPPQFVDGIPKLKPEENRTLELGFKGVLANKVFLDISGYRSWYKDFISPARPIGDFAKGIVTLDENGNPRKGEQTLSYINFGRQKVLGFDVGADVYATDRLVLKGNLSFIEAGKLEVAGGIPQPFNTPRITFNLGFLASDFLSKGTSFDVSFHHVERFDFLSGIHVGTVPAYTVVDVNLGYGTKHGVTYKLSATNVLDNDHLEFVSGPRIGRVVVGEVQYAF